MTQLASPVDIFLTRHAESEANKTDIIQGRNNTPLSSLGHTQAEAAGKWFSRREVDTLFCSPLQRTIQTASIIRSHTSAEEPFISDHLIELDTGIISGSRFSDLEKNDPELWTSFQLKSWDGIPQAEGSAELSQRAYAFWKFFVDFVQERNCKTVVCVSHAGIMQWLLRTAMGSRLDSWMPFFNIANCGTFHLSLSPVIATDHRSFHGQWNAMNFVPGGSTDQEPGK